MFDIVGDDIARLNDGDLRSAVARLAAAEIRMRGGPICSVVAGGSQDAADGGIDVRVDCPSDLEGLDFVPRKVTGFQVKRPDMPPSAIMAEMRPEGLLRDVIGELADQAGAYVIVSAQGSVADRPLASRRKAMRDALNDHPHGNQLHIDFYDRDRIATWANQHPGVAAWLRARVGRPLSGWSSIGNWVGANVLAAKPYLLNDNACLVDEHSHDSKLLTAADGIERLRAILRIPKQCVRLIGLSGLGKTRLVQALFENGVAGSPLDPGLALYTDYSEETLPTAREMARQLIAQRQRAILVVDNCNPATHSELASLCSSELSEISLITVEYDVGDEEREHTEVFRLQSASAELLTEWMKQDFPDMSHVDRDKIVEFSEGNFRVARALAETLGKGETLGRITRGRLFERIFWQRNQPDQQLLKSAEDLALLYSVDGVDISSEGELARVGSLRGTGSLPLYEALAEMQRRGVVQARGQFRAILPQAVANPLAASALERIPPVSFDAFCQTLTPRMLRSVSRRLGYLHDSVVTQSIVERWLRSDGPLGNLVEKGNEGFRIIENIAPVTPEAVLAKLEAGVGWLSGDGWKGLVRSIAYDERLFDRAATLLARFAGLEQENNNLNSTRNVFSGLFHLHLSGTQASPEQRRALIRRLAVSSDDNLKNSALVALEALVKSNGFMSTARHDFGARSRDWGWQPKFNRDIGDWYTGAMELAAEMLPNDNVRSLLAKNARSLWRYPACRKALNAAANNFVKTQPWIEGWLAFRASLRYDGKRMPADVRTELVKLIELLKPVDPLSRARAIIYNRMNNGVDFADGEKSEENVMKGWETAEKMARELGYEFASEPALRVQFLPELLTNQLALRAIQFGDGLAQGTEDLDSMWNELIVAYGAADPVRRTPSTLCGFIFGANQRDSAFTSMVLDAAIEDEDLESIIPLLQAQAGLGPEGIARLRKAIAKGRLSAACFRSIANGYVMKSPPEALSMLIKDIATLTDGVEIALDILQMHLHQYNGDANAVSPALIAEGQSLLVRANYSRYNDIRDFAASGVISVCLAGAAGQNAAGLVCANIRARLEAYEASSYELSAILQALFETQPIVALDAFLLHGTPIVHARLFDGHSHLGSPLDKLSEKTLIEWAMREPSERFQRLGPNLSMFGKNNGEDKMEFSQVFLSMLSSAPDKRQFLGDLWDRVHPQSWSGSLADIFTGRKSLLIQLAEESDADVMAWVAEAIPQLDSWIDRERQRERSWEESFE